MGKYAEASVSPKPAAKPAVKGAAAKPAAKPKTVKVSDCDDCVKTKMNSWCSTTGRCFNGFGYYMATVCPKSKKDPRPFWGQGCKGLKAHGVWGNDGEKFFNSPWARIRDRLALKVLGYDIRARYGRTYSQSKLLGCCDDQASNYNPYRPAAPACTGLQALKIAQDHIKQAAISSKKAAKAAKKLQKTVKNVKKTMPKKALQKKVVKALKRKAKKAVAHEVKHAKAVRRQEMKVAKSEPGCAFCEFTKDTPTKKKGCSVTCACSAGGLLTPYGKYSGKSYTGCPGEVPCDPVDSVAQMHDWCVTNNGALACTCAHQIYITSVAAGKYLKKNPKEGLCQQAPRAADELAFEAGMQWGACKVASKACKTLWLNKVGVECGKDHDMVEPTLMQRFSALDADSDGEISLAEAYDALATAHKDESPAHHSTYGAFSMWHKRFDENSSGGLSVDEYKTSWGL